MVHGVPSGAGARFRASRTCVPPVAGHDRQTVTRLPVFSGPSRRPAATPSSGSFLLLRCRADP